MRLFGFLFAPWSPAASQSMSTPWESNEDVEMVVGMGYEFPLQGMLEFAPLFQGFERAEVLPK